MKLRSTLEELASGCLKYVAITKNSLTGPGTGKTKLDKERMKLCEREIVRHSFLFSKSSKSDYAKCLQLLQASVSVLIGGHWEYVKEPACIGHKKFDERTFSNCTKLSKKTEVLGGRCKALISL